MRLTAGVCAAALIAAAGVLAYALRDRVGAGAQPDGLLVFATGADWETPKEIAVARPDGSGFQRLTRHAPAASQPRWTSNGRRIIFSSGPAFWRMNADGHHLHRIAGGTVPSGRPHRSVGEPSPSGARVAILRRGRVLLTAARGRVLRTLRVAWRAGEFPNAVLWSPDERKLAITIEPRASSRFRTVVLRTDGRGRPRPVRVGERSDITPVAWSPNGTVLLVFDQERYGYLLFRPADGSLRSVPGLPWSAPVSWARDSRRIAYVDTRGDVFVTNAFASGRRRVGTIRPKPLRFPTGEVPLTIAWSPRRDEIAIGDYKRIWLLRLGGRARVLAEKGDVSFSWSPDGERLVFASHGDVDILTRGRKLRRVTDTASDDAPVWSADGSRVAFVRDPVKAEVGLAKGSVYVVDADGHKQQRLGTGSEPRWSPAAPRVAFAARTGIVIFDLLTRKRTRIQANIDSAPAWSPDGSQIAFARLLPDQETVAVDAVALAGGLRRTLAHIPSLQSDDVAWSTDGETIAVSACCGDETVLVDAHTGAVRTLRGLINTTNLRWSPDSSELAYAMDDGSGGLPLGVVQIDSGRRTVIGRGGDHAPVWSPDGRWLAFSDRRHAYVTSGDGSHRRRVTQTPGGETAIDWTGGHRR